LVTQVRLAVQAFSKDYVAGLGPIDIGAGAVGDGASSAAI